MNHLHIPTITAVSKPILSSIPPIDWCPHNTTKHLCAFCSKWYSENKKGAPALSISKPSCPEQGAK